MKLLNKTFIPLITAIALVACGKEPSKPQAGYNKIKESIRETYVSQGISDKVITYDYCLYAWPKKNPTNLHFTDFTVGWIYYSLSYTVKLSTPETYIICVEYYPKSPNIYIKDNLLPYQSAYENVTNGILEGEVGEL